MLNMWTKGIDIALRFTIKIIAKKKFFTPPTLAHLVPFACFQVNPELKHHFEDRGFRFVGQDLEGERMEVIELEGQCMSSI